MDEKKRLLKKKAYNFEDLLSIMRILRAPDGCPWDREQTHVSVRGNFIEEVYEACEAIDQNDSGLLCEELGDVLLQVVLHCDIAEDFDIDNVCDGICKKLIYRHPHIFSDSAAETSEKVLSTWERLKSQEKGHNTYTESLNAVAKSLPALIRAQKVQQRAAKSGFDIENIEISFIKIKEELDEAAKEVYNNDGNFEEELGDLLFAVVNAARFKGVSAEQALSKATEKFMARFEKVENEALSRGKTMKDFSAAELDEIWERIK